MQEDPILLFQQWFKDAETSEPTSSNAMSLATADSTGRVSSRMLLLKEIQDGQFIFYTNLRSQKAQQINENPQVALCFHWKSLKRQVRIEGEACQVSDDIADAYFATRPRESQMGAWASKQSEVMENSKEIHDRIKHFEQKFLDQDIPRPPFWSGFEVNPNRIEFWTQKPFRLHERRVYIREHLNTWDVKALYP